MQKYTTKSDKETFALAKKISRTLQGGEVIALYGNLSAGKTVFAKGIAAGLGVKAIITSPTFTLMNVYPVKRREINTLVHIDCYRLKYASELLAIGVGEYLDNPQTVTVIEWAERVETLLKKEIVTVNFAMTKNNHRSITLLFKNKKTTS